MYLCEHELIWGPCAFSVLPPSNNRGHALSTRFCHHREEWEKGTRKSDCRSIILTNTLKTLNCNTEPTASDLSLAQNTAAILSLPSCLWRHWSCSFCVQLCSSAAWCLWPPQSLPFHSANHSCCRLIPSNCGYPLIFWVSLQLATLVSFCPFFPQAVAQLSRAELLFLFSQHVYISNYQLPTLLPSEHLKGQFSHVKNIFWHVRVLKKHLLYEWMKSEWK